jgi:hypothetical protein
VTRIIYKRKIKLVLKYFIESTESKSGDVRLRDGVMKADLAEGPGWNKSEP